MVTLESADSKTEFMVHFFLDDTQMNFMLFENSVESSITYWTYTYSSWYSIFRSNTKASADASYVTPIYNTALKSLSYDFPDTSGEEDVDSGVVTLVSVSGNTFSQKVDVPVGDKTYTFNSVYTWDPANVDSFEH